MTKTHQIEHPSQKFSLNQLRNHLIKYRILLLKSKRIILCSSKEFKIKLSIKNLLKNYFTFLQFLKVSPPVNQFI